MESITEERHKAVNTEVAKEKSTIKDTLVSTSHIWKVSAVIFLLGFVFHLISFASPFWIVEKGVTNSSNIGIWAICSSDSNCRFRDDNSDCLLSVRVFQSLAVVSGTVMLVLTITYAVSETSRPCKEKSSIVTGFVSALCIQIGTGIFGRSNGCNATAGLNTSNWAWSLALSITSVVLYCTAVFLMILDQLRRCASQGKQPGKRKHDLGLNIT